MTYKKFKEKYCDGTWEVQDDGGVTSREFDQFARDLKSVLKEICGTEWEVKKYSKGHYFVSAFLRNTTNPDKFLYLNVDDIRYNPNWHKNILYRTAEKETDYRGGPNRYSSLEDLSRALENENRIINEEVQTTSETVSIPAKSEGITVAEATESHETESEQHGKDGKQYAASQKFERIINETFFTLTEEEKSEGITEEKKKQRYEFRYRPMADEIRAEITAGNAEVIKEIEDFSEGQKHPQDGGLVVFSRKVVQICSYKKADSQFVRENARQNQGRF